MAELTFQKIGEKLKKARKLSGFTQAQVSEYLGGIQRENISYYENGTRPIDMITLNKLADLYGYSLSYFLNINETDSKPAVSAAFRVSDDLVPDDLAIILWVKKFAMNLSSVKNLLGE